MMTTMTPTTSTASRDPNTPKTRRKKIEVWAKNYFVQACVHIIDTNVCMYNAWSKGPHISTLFIYTYVR